MVRMKKKLIRYIFADLNKNHSELDTDWLLIRIAKFYYGAPQKRELYLLE